MAWFRPLQLLLKRGVYCRSAKNFFQFVLKVETFKKNYRCIW